jgi:hypothetical protein
VNYFLLIMLSLSSSFSVAAAPPKGQAEDCKLIPNQDACIRLPYMSEGYIPQGIHITASNKAYVSMYHKDRGGKQSENSIVVEIDINEKNELKRTTTKYVLPTKSHVGGIAIFDKEKRFVVPSGLKFCIYEKPTSGYLIEDENCQIQSVGSSKKTTAFSFINYAPDHNGKWHMWAGQFEYNKDYGNVFDGMHIFGYAVDGDSISENPSYRFYVPPQVDKIQGASVIAPKNSTDDYKILVSSSYGPKPSHITLLTYDFHEPYHYKYKYKSFKNVYTAPAGLEEIHATANSGTVWGLFESGAQYYAKKWAKKSPALPYMFRIPISELVR